MAVTSAEIQTRLEGMGYPCLTDAALSAVISQAEVELSSYTPLKKFVTALSVVDKTDYYIWDPAATEYIAGAANALSVEEVYWNPGTDFSATAIFSPDFEIMSNTVLFNGSPFHSPSDITVLKQKIDAWRNMYGSQGFEVVGQVGEPTAYIKIFPIPQVADATIIFQIGTYYTIADVTSLSAGYGRFLFQWIEAFAAEAVANEFSKTAGVEFSLFKSGDKGLSYWERRAIQKRQFATDQQGGLRGEAARG